MNVRLLPVHSKVADTTTMPLELRQRLPPGWQLSEHQVKAYEALLNRQTEVVFNTALTGDGKSLAAYLPVLINEHHAFGMYPTIELSRDQARQFEGYCRNFQCRVCHLPLWGAEMTRLAKEHGFKERGEWLVAQFKNYGVILTNPDIFNLVMNYRYRTFIYNAVELPYSLGIGYDYFVFDEFHVFEMPQIVSAVTAMLWLIEHNPGKAPRFVFSSATPDPLILKMVERAGLKYTLVEGQYVSRPTVGYRPVLHQAELQLYQLRERETAEDWLHSHLDELVAVWRSAVNRRPKGVIIVNSVAAARRIAQWLAQELPRHGITIGENTGLTDLERRQLARECDLIVGTSTIDVGVDFDINLLIFEVIDAGTFLQRLGRLGRVRQGEMPFDTYQAYALLPGRSPWIYACLTQELRDRGIREGDSIDRQDTLASVVQAAFPLRENFVSYARRWGVLQGAHILNVLRNRRYGGAYDTLAQPLQEQYGRLFNIPSFKGAVGRYRDVRDRMDGGEQVLDEVLSFRGTSPFQVGLWDATVNPPAFRLYNLFFIIQSAEFDIVNPETFEDALRQWVGDQWELRLEEFKYGMKGNGDQPLYLRVTAFYPERERLLLQLINEDLSESPELLDTIRVLCTFRIAEPRTAHVLNVVNEVLKRQQVVCCISKRDRGELWRQLCLPPLFPLYRLHDQRGNREYSVAFGKEALMLEPLLVRLRNKDENEAPVIV